MPANFKSSILFLTALKPSQISLFPFPFLDFSSSIIRAELSPLFETIALSGASMAFLRIADALDREHIQNVKQVLVSLEKPNLLLTLEASGDTQIEEWAIKNKGRLFEKTFGLKVIIRNNTFNKECLT